MSPRDGAGEGDDPRRLALEVLLAVAERDAYANLLLADKLRRSGLSGRDAAFATELTYGTLRWQGTYDAAIQRCLTRTGELDLAVRCILRLGAHQLMSMRVPAHAAVTTTVELAKSHRRSQARRAAGLVNAVMRRVADRSPADWFDSLTRGFPAGSDRDLAIRHAHPPWLVGALRQALIERGRAESELRDLLDANNVPAQVTIAARPGRSTIDELLADPAAATARPGRWSPQAVVLDNGDPAAISAVREGRAGVQDEGSQLAALAAANLPVTPGRDQRWLDMCAGPGGKAALLAALAAERGTRLEAWEMHEHRARLVSHQVGDRVRVRVVDATDEAVVTDAQATFDRVLLDAPCSGAGALRRRPESRWRRDESALSTLVDTQRRLLRSALRVVRPGGVVLYVTCSPIVAETADVVDSVLASDDFAAERLDVTAVLPPSVADTGDRPDMQLWPHVQGTDAMYLSALRRVS